MLDVLRDHFNLTPDRMLFEIPALRKQAVPAQIRHRPGAPGRGPRGAVRVGRARPRAWHTAGEPVVPAVTPLENPVSSAQTAPRGFFVFVVHVLPGCPHRGDAIVQRHEMRAVSVQRQRTGRNRLDRAQAIALDAGHLDETGHRIAGQAEVMFQRDFRRVLLMDGHGKSQKPVQTGMWQLQRCLLAFPKPSLHPGRPPPHPQPARQPPPPPPRRPSVSRRSWGPSCATKMAQFRS